MCLVTKKLPVNSESDSSLKERKERRINVPVLREQTRIVRELVARNGVTTQAAQGLTLDLVNELINGLEHYGKSVITAVGQLEDRIEELEGRGSLHA